MLEEIKKEFYETFPQNRFVGYTSNIIWPFIEQKLTEAIKQAKIEEITRVLDFDGGDIETQIYDRINELKEISK